MYVSINLLYHFLTRISSCTNIYSDIIKLFHFLTLQKDQFYLIELIENLFTTAPFNLGDHNKLINISAHLGLKTV